MHASWEALHHVMQCTAELVLHQSSLADYTMRHLSRVKLMHASSVATRPHGAHRLSVTVLA